MRPFFQIGSITKTVTATALMRLVERGALDLQAPVRDYLPGFRVRDEDVDSVRHGLAFADAPGGLDRVMSSPIPAAGDDAAARYVDGMADFEQLAPLGRHFSYNNASFCVAGRIIEVLTGATYEDALAGIDLRAAGHGAQFLLPASGDAASLRCRASSG